MPIRHLIGEATAEMPFMETVEFEAPGELELHVTETPDDGAIQAVLYLKPLFLAAPGNGNPSMQLGCVEDEECDVNAYTVAGYDDAKNAGYLVSIQHQSHAEPTVSVRILDQPKGEASYFTFTVDELRRFGLSKS